MVAWLARATVPAGTVALANQAAIYSLTSPGGWRWLGRTAIKMFTPEVDPPTYLRAGDRVRFVPISEEEYLEMGGEKVFFFKQKTAYEILEPGLLTTVQDLGRFGYQ